MITGLFDHVATIHRFTDAKVGSFREKRRSWSPVAGMSDRKVAVNLSGGGLEERGPGELPAVDGMAYGPAGLDVRTGDVLEVTSGPNAPLTMEVKRAYKPRGHHTEMELMVWEGSLG